MNYVVGRCDSHAITYSMRSSGKEIFLAIHIHQDLNFLSEWGESENCHLLVVDGSKKTVSTKYVKVSSIKHYCWEDIENDLGEKSWIIPRINAGIRNYGFWKANQLLGYDLNVIFTQGFIKCEMI